MCSWFGNAASGWPFKDSAGGSRLPPGDDGQKTLEFRGQRHEDHDVSLLHCKSKSATAERALEQHDLLHVADRQNLRTAAAQLCIATASTAHLGLQSCRNSFLELFEHSHVVELAPTLQMLAFLDYSCMSPYLYRHQHPKERLCNEKSIGLITIS